MIEEPPLIKKVFKLFKRQSQKIKSKNKKLYKQFIKLLRSLKLKLNFNLNKIKLTTKKIAIFLIVLIFSIINPTNAYANDYFDKFFDEKNIKEGTDIISTEKISQINNYLSFQNYLKVDEKQKNLTYISKPLIITTQSREEIEKKIALEKQQKEYEEYQRYIAYQNTRNVYAREEAGERNNTYEPVNNSNYENTYYYGYCTWYVANKINVPNNWGNGGQWLYSAQINGYPTGNTPQNQAIIVTSESYWGHVGIVEEVKENTIVISEMNYVGWGIVNTREISKTNPIIKGYIY